MSRHRAVALMLLVTLLWSSAGVVARHLQAAQGFEVTFWRSAFTALFMALALTHLQGRRWLRSVLKAPRAVWLSGLCWAVMFTAFMQAIMLTRVANVLVTMALGPLLTALFARLFLQHRMPTHTWWAMALGSAGVALMFALQMDMGAQHWRGMLIALAVPLAAATNWTVLQHKARAASASADEPDTMLCALWMGALASALFTGAVMLFSRWSWSATPQDLLLLGGLGLFQLVLPCLLVVRLSRELPAPEIALLGLLEVVLGVLWAWWGAGEAPAAASLIGGGMVLAALAFNEAINIRAAR
ncbi:DMT family transporter [Roseateles sp. BYS180W]|uniref:DMT family transporter n=1 Tax=Roseateles rivi TaxID=3299028 RepID=A0ABW7FVE9_9BURK